MLFIYQSEDTTSEKNKPSKTYCHPKPPYTKNNVSWQGI